MSPKISDAKKEERRIAILNAAFECFSEKGYFITTVDDIVEASGASKGAIYLYFKSKEEIFISLTDYLTNLAIANFAKKFAEISSPLEKLRYFIQHNLPLTERQKKYYSVHYEFWLYSAKQPELRKFMEERAEKLIQFLAEIIQEGKEKGEFREEIDNRVMSLLLWATLDGIRLTFITVGDHKFFEESINNLERMIFHYLCEQQSD
jgi:AcrR family transcriptional regulator